MKSALWSTKWLAGRVSYVRTDDRPSIIAGDPSWYAAVSEAEIFGEHFDYIHRSRQALDDDTHLSMAFATSTVRLLTYPSAAAKDKDETGQHERPQPSWSQHLEHLQRLQELYISSLDFPAVAADAIWLTNVSTSTSTSTASTPSAMALAFSEISEDQAGREEGAQRDP
ncbi:uncharacterized protein LAESUDRAFT_811476 [Laetiporus sulphureus 93-53]|uniref:Uncharacterized protein n=1 Tax=Laetiporus sulphureus 93-53 TaxID=1314785 RepID=A0A165F4S4_9APHY|nr:uncharacterized protein LAESUDRAFT_811476 [Laetiporus sulphureus 93-53]KZT08387.1 hypothetical protein LAESUDRAFT_811476 [Laetiporus sulphureus 93-53]